jgi:hypothetical protein
MLRLGRHPKTATHNRAQSHRPHSFSDPIFTDLPAFSPQRPRDFGATRPTMAGLVESLNRLIQPLRFLLAHTRSAFFPDRKIPFVYHRPRRRSRWI